MEIISLIGIIGLGLLAVGWSIEAFKVIKTKKSNLGVNFGIIYSLGSFLLVIYSYFIGDVIFMILNTIVTLLSLVNLYYALKKK